MKEDVRKQLFRKLKKENCFWSYDMSKMKTISDELLIEYVFLYPVSRRANVHTFKFKQLFTAPAAGYYSHIQSLPVYFISFHAKGQYKCYNFFEII